MRIGKGASGDGASPLGVRRKDGGDRAAGQGGSSIGVGGGARGSRESCDENSGRGGGSHLGLQQTLTYKKNHL